MPSSVTRLGLVLVGLLLVAGCSPGAAGSAVPTGAPQVGPTTPAPSGPPASEVLRPTDAAPSATPPARTPVAPPTAAPTADPTIAPTPVPTAAPTAQAPTPSPTPAATPGPDATVIRIVPPKADAPGRGVGITWRRRYDGPGHIASVACGPVGCVQVVTFDEGGFPGAPTLSVSSDLRTWRTRRATGRGLDASVQAIAASSRRYVLAGNGAWWSDDARSWTRARTAAGGRVPVDQVASNGRTFIGWDPAMAHAGTWFSAGGRRWSRVRLPGAPALIVDAVWATPGGGYVLAGRAGRSIAALDAVEGESVRFGARPGRQGVWSSPDGRTWTRVPIAMGMEDVRLTSIAADGPGGGLLAAGPVEAEVDSEPATGIWRWTPVHGWQRLAGRRFATVAPDGAEVRVMATPARWLVVGRRADASRPQDATRAGVLAGSSDGRAWWGIDPVEFRGAGDYAIDAFALRGRRLVFGINRWWTGMAIGEDHHQVWISP